MRKSGVFLFIAALSISCSFLSEDKIYAKAEENHIVYVGGMSAGFTLKTDGAQVIGLCEVMSETSVKSPALEAGLHAGDVIMKIEGISIDNIAEMNEIINKGKGKELNFEIVRGGESFNKSIKPIKDRITEKYKIGVLVRDSVSGIGTITYVEKDSGRFGALGHAVCNEQNQPMHISNGNVYECNIFSVAKGVRGKAGELKGLFVNDKPFGKAQKLCECGIFGEINDAYEVKDWPTAIADSNVAKPGAAYIYSTVTGVCPQKYEVEIVKVDKQNRENKNFVIKIKDENLIAETGGIVQGMSGSPILQEGKLIGAITHVFLNDPTRGYGIDIKTMMSK